MVGKLNKILTITGLILVWIPVLAPAFFSIVALIQMGRFLFDFLMPAELFLVFLAGAILLLVASIRTKHYVKQIGFGLLSAVILLFGGQGIAVITGLASGEREFGDWVTVLVMVMIFLYIFAVIEIEIFGFYLLRKMNSNSSADTERK
ncbi:hypothetical protein [Fervidobacterium gondwanense]|uniref:Uncharacterized protein n=1 Tax=Fervidobacterium gondwanense DSM 13020 TaxID=1121883 RepID=A0A1M7S8N3_FERGO|nr:hypothetical protein [Fervidobacterium gondwanense]SHN54778.1 hypothetical protein SAMN02745226_00654 [Fervidobacterium gondwanense DSM 13020]